MRSDVIGPLVIKCVYIVIFDGLLPICASVAVRAVYSSANSTFVGRAIRAFGISLLAVFSSLVPIGVVILHPESNSNAIVAKLELAVLMLAGAVFAYGYAYGECYRFARGAAERLSLWDYFFPDEADSAMASAAYRILAPACIEVALTLSLVQALVVSTVEYSSLGLGGPPSGPPSNEFAAFLVGLIVMRFSISPLIRVVDPTGFVLRNLFIASMDDNVRKNSLVKLSFAERTSSVVGSQAFVNTTMSRWRSRIHKSSVLASSYLLRSTAGMERKYSKTDCEYIRSTCMRMSYILQVQSIERDNTGYRASLADVCTSVAKIILSDNPIAACRDAQALTADYDVPDIEYRRGNRFAKMLATMEAFFERNSKVLLVLLGVAVFVGYVHSVGSIPIALERLFPVFGGK